MDSFEDQEPQAKRFDLVVTHRDPKTGLTVKTNPYTVRETKAADGSRSRYYERPVGSGNLFNKKGEAVGRWDKNKPEGERFIAGAAHVEFIAPLTEDQRLKKQVVEDRAKIAELERELAAIKAEQDKKSAAPQQKKGQGV